MNNKKYNYIYICTYVIIYIYVFFKIKYIYQLISKIKHNDQYVIIPVHNLHEIMFKNNIENNYTILITL